MTILDPNADALWFVAEMDSYRFEFVRIYEDLSDTAMKLDV